MEHTEEGDRRDDESVSRVRARTALVAVLVLGVVGLISLVVLAVLVRADPPTSGDRWNLVDLGVDVDRTAGEVFSRDTPQGVEVTILVETYTGGVELCDPFAPALAGVDNRSSEIIVFEIEWPKRGCSDRGPYSFTVELENMRLEGRQVAFLPSPEAVDCPLVTVAPRQGVVDVSSINCTELPGR